jgi:hypothetical protein
MTQPLFRTSIAAAVFALASTGAVPLAQGRAGATAIATQASDAVPSDLRPLLTPSRSEMRLVTQRYSLDRTALESNYAGASTGRGGGGGRGRGGGAATPAPQASSTVSMSLARLDRLAQFDRAWQGALERLNAPALSTEARAELTALRATASANAARLEAERRAVAEVTPVLPFAPPLVRLIEARIWIEEMDAKAAAGTLTRAIEQITATRARLQAAIDRGPDALPASRDQATRAAAVVDALHRDLT